MELLQLRYFQKVGHLEHMTKAAEELYISQPSLSKTIRSLEKELGVLLFERRGKYIKLNEYGKVFLRHIDTALAAIDDGKRQLCSMDKKQVEHINLAFLAASPVLPDLLSSFCNEYPNVHFNLIQYLSKENNYSFDLCVSSLPINMEGITSLPLITENFLLAVPKDHPFANRKSIYLREVANEGFIHLTPRNALREITDSFCKLAGFSPRIIFESDNPATVRGLIRAGQGIGFIPSISWGDSIGSSVKLLQIKKPVCQRTILLSWMKHRYQSDILLLFRQFIIEYFEKLERHEFTL